MNPIKLLDMNENEQYRWLLDNNYIVRASDQSLADLAFRLRDEVEKTVKWIQAKEEVAKKCSNGLIRYIELIEGLDGANSAIIGRINDFFVNKAQPIHWICAALIAMGEKNEASCVAG